MLRDVVVVGASLAGLRAAETLRTQGFEGSITLIGAEPHLPYDRPPLSKKLLAGEWEPERIALRHADEYGGLDLTMRLGVRASALDLDRRRVVLADGEDVPFDGVILATGAAPRRLPQQPELAGLHELRTLDDALALRADLAAGPVRLVVIGAGFIGAEVAATAHQHGAEVTILEALPVPLARALGEQMGLACSAVHGDHGVDLRLGVGVAGFAGTDRVEAVLLADGTRIETDVVVVGVGVAPTTGWIESSGLELRDGVVCDATLCAGPHGVYAAGDLARWPHALLDREVRLEHWSNANEQGAAAAANLLAVERGETPTPFGTIAFFWSDQYEARIQFLGRAEPGDEVRVVHGSVDERRFVALYGRDGRLTAALGLTMPKLLMSYRKLLVAGATWDEALAHAAAVAS